MGVRDRRRFQPLSSKSGALECRKSSGLPGIQYSALRADESGVCWFHSLWLCHTREVACALRVSSADSTCLANGGQAMLCPSKYHEHRLLLALAEWPAAATSGGPSTVKCLMLTTFGELGLRVRREASSVYSRRLSPQGHQGQARSSATRLDVPM